MGFHNRKGESQEKALGVQAQPVSHSDCGWFGFVISGSN